MKKWLQLAGLMLLCVCFSTQAHAQKKKLGQAGFQFLKIGLSARAEAMAGAYSMVGDDADALFYNPAGLTRMASRSEVTAHYVPWIADITLTGFGAAYKSDYGAFAIDFASVNYGDIIGTQVAATEQGYSETGNVSVGSYFAGLAYAKQLTSKFTVGGQLKYVSEHLGASLISPVNTPTETVENRASSVNVAFGTIYNTGLKSLQVGICIRNFSPESEYQRTGFQAPLTFDIGIALDLMDMYPGEHPNHSLVLALDAVHPRDFSERLNLGTEYWFQNMFALRGGYRFNHDMEGLTAGVGVKHTIGQTGIRVDYCFSQNKYFSNVNRLSLGVSF
jgi:hypothetical protein